MKTNSNGSNRSFCSGSLVLDNDEAEDKGNEPVPCKAEGMAVSTLVQAQGPPVEPYTEERKPTSKPAEARARCR